MKRLKNHLGGKHTPISIGGASADAAFLTMAKFVTMALSFAVTRLLSQFFSVYDYGTYSQIMLLVSTLSSLTTLGMTDAINYFYCAQKQPKKQAAYVSTIFFLQTAISAVTGGALLLMSGLVVAYFENPDVKGLLLFAAILPFLQNLISMLQILFVSVGKARLLAFRNLAVSALRLCVAAGVCLLEGSVLGVLLCTVLLDVGQILFFRGMLQRAGCYVGLRHTDLHLIRPILQYSVPMAVFITLNTINRDCDKYVISAFTDTQTLAVYTNASKVLPFDVIMQSFTTVLLPHITRSITAGQQERARTLYRHFIEITYISTGILACGALTVAPNMIRLLYTEKYMDGLWIFVIYTLVDILRFTNITLLLSASGKTRTLMLVAAAGLTGNLLLDLLLFRLMGVIGPAVATWLITLAVGLTILSLGAKVLGTTLRGLFHGRYLMLFFGESAMAVAAFTGLRLWLERLGVPSVAVLFLVYGAYALTMLLLNRKRIVNNLRAVSSAT